MKHELVDGDEKILSSHSISRMSYGLIFAAVVLVLPLIVLVYLYLTEINREIKLIDRQISSIQIMQQFVALQINLADEYYGRFYPSAQALEKFSEQDDPLDTTSSRAEPIALLATQFKALETELDRKFNGDLRTWPVIKEQLIALWGDEAWTSSLVRLEAVNAPVREFVSELFVVSNLELSNSEQIRTAARLLFVEVGQSKFSLFHVTEQLALLVYLKNTKTVEEDIRTLDSAIGKIYIASLNARTIKVLGESDFISAVVIADQLKLDDLVKMSRRLLEKHRRLLFIGALAGETDDLGLTIEVETLRGMVWDRVNGYNRIQIHLAGYLAHELTEERESIASWRTLMLFLVISLTTFGVFLGAYIISNIRLAQTQLGQQNISLEATVKSRTEEIVNAKNEAEQLNKVLGRQTQISSDLARKADMANSAKSLFLAAMSHEIRTPLNAVLGGATILSKTDLNARQKNILNLITQSGKTLLDLINEILDFSKIEANQLQLEKIPFDLESTIIDIVSMFSLKAKEKEIYLRLFIDCKIEGMWLGDPLRIKQIVINLLSNAVKFTHIGGISVRVVLDDQGRVVIGVHDTGIGIKSDQMKYLFEAFVQSDSSTTRKYGGTGLGLSISKRLALLQSGDISIESALGRGSSFLLSLPLQRSSELISIEKLVDVKIFLLSSTPELERQIRQWCDRLQVFDDINQLAFYLEELDLQTEKNIVIVAESAALVHHHDQWVQEVTHRDVKQLAYPWVLLTSQDAIDCEDSQQISEQLKSLGANVQLPLLSSGQLIRQAIRRSYQQPENVHEYWVEKQPEIELGHYSGRVLLVEDVYFNRVIARELLESFGLVVESVENGWQAVDFMEHAYNLPDKDEMPIKLILMDLHMPEMNGLDATRRIRNMEKSMRLQATPIVAMTADVLLETREDIVQAGMNGYLPKPFEESELHDILKTYFGIARVEVSAALANSENIDSFYAHELSGRDGSDSSFNLEASSAAIFDHQALSGRLRGRTDRIAELTESFLSGLPETINSIKVLAKNKCYEELIFTAHTLKGTSANLGAEQLHNTAARIERFSKQLQNDFDELDLIALNGIIETLDNMAIALQSAIDSYLNSL